MRQALDTGDEKFLPLRDKGPQKRFARDYVDARFSLGEYLMFGALVFVIISLAGAGHQRADDLCPGRVSG